MYLESDFDRGIRYGVDVAAVLENDHAVGSAQEYEGGPIRTFLVHRQTEATARTVGLLDRGVVAPGYRADLNVIEWERLAALRPEIRYDLPAGGKRFVQPADGYVATINGGEITYENGEPTGALPGRLIRGPRSAPSERGTP